MVAHGAAFVGCFALLKDYATTPAYKGVGIFIALFGVGFVLAISAYILTFVMRALFGNPRSGR